MSARHRTASATGALAAVAWAACASGPVEPVVDLTPFRWTASQVSLDTILIRYGFPDEPAADDATAFAEPRVGPGASERRLASHRYGCAREDREQDAPCTVFLDFWLLELEPPLAGATPEALRARLDLVYGASSTKLVRDSRGREWCQRALALESGAAFAHYSRPIDARRALAVTSFTTRAPDRVAARDLARDAIDRAVIADQHE